MLIIRNAYDDRDFVFTVRDRTTGRDGDTYTLAVGDNALTLDLDGDYELIASTRPREPGEAPQRPAFGDGAALEAEIVALVPAPDDVVRSILGNMISAGENLTQTGLPELPAVNGKLKALGHTPISAAQRAALLAPQEA